MSPGTTASTAAPVRTVKIVLALGSVFVGAGLAPAKAQPPDSARRATEMLDVRCDTCHACTAPTVENRCLRGCPRSEAMRIAKEFEAMRSPRLVMLDELEDVYLPVPFDHEGHARMAQMTGNCAVCHHYTPEGLKHPACKTCHEPSSGKSDIRKPGLKGAYHRQCMGCHREWSGETRCGVCHHAKAGAAAKGGSPVVPTPDDLMGRMHPPIPEPEVEVYTIRNEGSETNQVIFRHKEHIHTFGLRCAECHHEDNCKRCHEEGRNHTQRTRTFEDHHKPCLDCHRNDSCDRCHVGEGQSPPRPFDHAQTGWPLGRYHEGKSCRVCHATVPFGKLDRNCNACHPSWTPANFNHDLTGQRLDENHARFDCEPCHVERRFDRPPTCDSCHGADEGIVFPNKRPGGVLRGAGS